MRKKISTIAICLSAIIVGVITGIFITNKGMVVNALEGYNEFLDVYTEKAPVEPSVMPQDGDTPLNFNGLELFNICYYNLLNETNVESVTTGGIKASITTQLVNNKKKYDGVNFFSESISKSPFAEVAERQYYYIDRNNSKAVIMSLLGTNVDSNATKATWNGVKTKYDISQFVYAYGNSPLGYIPYKINESTLVDKVSDIAVRKTNNGYEFTLNLKPEAAEKYAKQVRKFSNALDLPTFSKIQLNFVVDENFNFISINTVDKYTVNINIVGRQTCEGNITEVFTLGKKVTILPDEVIPQ